MSLKERINTDIKAAMKAKDQDALRALRAIKSAIMVLETSDAQHHDGLTEAEELQLLNRQAKQRRDSIQQFRDNGRDDLADKEAVELAIIERYLPQQLSEAELETAVKALIAETGASSMKDMGKVMGLATQRLAGQADNRAISNLVRKLLA
ncbi:MAG: GatB/YqeY domain-containing protein [Bacteroidetes bacterium]|nr:MAG: GatB/YqeY domain-containing protein [Bacteroidota bacterium]